MKKLVVTDDWSPSEIYSTMGCRTVNGLDINFKETYESYIKALIKGETPRMDLTSALQKDGRGNICPVTIILPTIAMEADEMFVTAAERGSDEYKKAHVESFFELLDKKMEEAKDMLIERFNWICKQDMRSAKFMYENHTMAGYVPEEGIKSALKHGTLTIGLLGLAETLQLLVDCDQTEPEGFELGVKIADYWVKKCNEYKEKYKLNFASYWTPSENLCYTAMKKFIARYGVIKNVSDKSYFTNSVHVPVWKDMDPFEKADIESHFANKGKGGTIFYAEFPSTAKHNTEALEAFVKYCLDLDIPYIAINTPNDCCEDCGYQDEINDVCPKCGSDNISRLRRVTGYLSGDYKTAFNVGKQEEVEHRVKHIKN